VEAGDPQNWGNGSALFTIHMEPQGVKGDCIPPLNYHNGGMGHSLEASVLLRAHDCFIEFINAAVACVFKG
jgi:hypothetical protein